MKNKDFSTKLTGIDGLIDIADEYNYEVLSIANGFGDGPLKTDYEPDSVDKSLIYNDALHYIYMVPTDFAAVAVDDKYDEYIIVEIDGERTIEKVGG